MSQIIDLYKQLTTELSKINNDLLDATIRSYEAHLGSMTPDELHDAAQELLWMAEDLLSSTQDIAEEEDDFVNEEFLNEIIEEAEKYFDDIVDLL